MKLFSRIIFFSLVTELILGGGGRLTAFGPVSLRMILFMVAVLVSVVYFFQGKRLPKPLTIFLACFIASLVLSLIIGITSGADRIFWIEDVKPLSYVLILPFFYFVLEDTNQFNHFPDLVILGGVFLAVSFFATLVLIHSAIIPFLSFYYLIIDTGEFFFRAETTFFYKGFIYLCIGLIFSFFLRPKYRNLIIFILLTAILLTFTRGFIFGLALTYVFFAWLEKKYIHMVVSILIAISVLVFSKPVIYQLSSALHAAKNLDAHVPKDKLLGNRDESDSGRIQQVEEVATRITPLSFIAGHGFGNGVPSRPVHMEISYLEIFHKQGVIGLMLWAYLFFQLFRNFKRTRHQRLSQAFFFAAAFIFFQSLTNQFVNNPIGLSFVLLSLVYLHERARMSKDDQTVKAHQLRHQKGDEIPAASA